VSPPPGGDLAPLVLRIVFFSNRNLTVFSATIDLADALPGFELVFVGLSRPLETSFP